MSEVGVKALGAQPSRLIGLLLFGFGLMLACPTLQGQTVRFERSDAVPEGFEVAQDRQFALVDVHFAGAFLTTQAVEYDADWLHFEQPKALLQALEHTELLQNLEHLEPALSEPLAHNTDALCPAQATPIDCVQLKPETAAIIFDSSRFRLELLIGSAFFKLQTDREKRYLEAAFDLTSGISKIRLQARRQSDQPWQLSLHSDTHLAWHAYRFEWQAQIDNQQNATTTRALWLREYHDHRWQIGLFRPNTSLAEQPLPAITGLRFSTHLARRLDQALLQSNALVLSLMQRSSVQLWLDDTLYHQADYPAGKQVIDTRALPIGSYPLRIHVQNAAQGEYVLQRWLSKSQTLPPAGQPSYFVELGCARASDKQAATDGCAKQRLVNAGIRVRTAANQALSLSTTHYANDTLVGLQHQLIGQYTRVNQHWALAGHYRQWSLDASTQGGTVQGALSYRQTDARAGQSPITNDAETSLLGPAQRQARATLRGQYKQAQYQLSAHWLQQAGHGDTHGIEASVEYPLFNNGRYHLMLNAHYAHQRHRAKQLSFAAELRFKSTQGSYALRTEQRQGQRPDGQPSYHISARHARALIDTPEQYAAIAVSPQHTADKQQLSLALNYRNTQLESQWQIDHSLEPQGDQQRYALALETHLLYDQHGVHLANLANHTSAALIELKADTEDANSALLNIDGLDRQALRGQGSTAVGLESYAKYRLGLSQAKEASSLTQVSQPSQSVVLYPGQLRRVSWQVAGSYLLIAQLVDEQAQPIRQAELSGGYHQALTDDQGIFQLEVSSGQQIIARENGGQRCAFKPPDRQQQGTIETLEQPLICSALAP